MHFPILFACVLWVGLVIVHAIISRRQGTPEFPGGRLGHWTYTLTLLISCLLLVIYLAGSAWIIFADLAWPHVGSKSGIFLFLLCPAILFQSFFLTSSLVRKKLPVRRIWVRLLSIISGILFAALIGNYTSTLAMQRFKQTSQPLVDLIEKNLPHPCIPQIPYTKYLPGTTGTSEWHPENMWKLWYDKESFILTFPGGSADIDGSTIYYLSKEKSWSIFHNDAREKAGQLQELLKGMQECQWRTDS